MFSISRTLFVLLFSLSLVSTAIAQTRRPVALPSSPIVTATTSNGRVRYASLGEVNQLRLQVFSADGSQVYDTEFRLGNLIDWRLLDQQGQALRDGSYLFLVTVKDFGGTLTQKFGTALVEGEQISLQQTGKDDLPVEQGIALQANRVEALSPVDRVGAAMLTSTVGAPNREVIVIDNAPPTKDKPTTTAAPGGENIQGTGTQNRLTKWGDNAGTVTDAEAAEVSGLTIFGQNSSGQVAPLFPSAPTAHVLEVGVAPGGRTPLTLAGGSGVMEFWKDLGGGTGAPAAAVSMGLARPGLAATNDMIFSTYMPGPSWSERMRIASGGNVGIGTNNPAAKLDVNGDLNVTGNAVIIGNIAAKYQDVAEWVDARQAMDAGTVVSLDVTRRNSVRPSRNAYDSRIAGVVTAQPGVILGEAGNGKVMVTMSGRVMVKVDATKDPIRIGDLLVTSNKSGMAMRSRPIKVAGRLIHRPGTIIGKALEALPRGKGSILVLVSLQ